MENLREGITWYHHASCQIQRAGKTVYIDPWELPEGSPSADLILVTHEHFDHYSPADIRKISHPDTELVVPQSMFGKAVKNAHYVSPGDKTILAGIPIETVHAYNLKKTFHPFQSLWVGYIVEIEGVRYYHTGDSDFTPEMAQVKADVVFLPVGGTYTMDSDTAAQAIAAIRPKLAIPIHWGKLVGSREDAQAFVEKVAGIGEILEPGKRY